MDKEVKQIIKEIRTAGEKDSETHIASYAAINAKHLELIASGEIDAVLRLSDAQTALQSAFIARREAEYQSIQSLKNSN